MAISVSFIDDALIRPLFVTEITVKTTNYTIFRVQQVKISKNPYIVFIFTLFFQEPVKSGWGSDVLNFRQKNEAQLFWGS